MRAENDARRQTTTKNYVKKVFFCSLVPSFGVFHPRHLFPLVNRNSVDMVTFYFCINMPLVTGTTHNVICEIEIKFTFSTTAVVYENFWTEHIKLFAESSGMLSMWPCYRWCRLSAEQQLTEKRHCTAQFPNTVGAVEGDAVFENLKIYADRLGWQWQAASGFVCINATSKTVV